MMRLTTLIQLAAGLICMAPGAGPTQAQQPSWLHPDMIYVAQGPSVMGLDRDSAPNSGKRATPYARRMNAPWSADAVNDESPAHMVFLDSYLIDRYKTSNQDYAEFIKAKGHSAPAYWDDPRLNQSNQPVVGVSWMMPYCEFQGKRLPTEGITIID